MKKFKKLIALVTVAMFLLAFVAPAALAATDEQVGRLNGLNIVQGYPDGTFGLDKNITRAEFAVVAVKLLGIGDAIDGAKGVTKFKDVPASHWASGAINLAVGNGVIKGYPDGTFKPEANVTLAEATAMLVQVLGYGPSLTGVWPNNVMGKGSEIGLLKGVSVADFNAPATRGSVFTSADNALDIDVMKQTAFGVDPKWEVQTKTLLEDKLGYVKIKSSVIDQVPISDSSLKADEVHVTVPVGIQGTGKYTVVGNFDPNNFLGITGTAWLNTTDDEIIYFQADDTLISDHVDAIDNVGHTIKLADKDKTYDYVYSGDGATLVYVNFQAKTGDTRFSNIKSGMFVNAVLNGNTITAIYAFDMKSGIVDRVDTTNNKIYLSEPSGTIALDDTFSIVKDGKAFALKDIKAGMVVNYDQSTDAKYVRVSDKVVTGTLSSVSTGDDYDYGVTVKLKIGDTTYKTAAMGSQSEYSTNDGQDWSTIATIDDLTDINGKAVTANLDSFGRVAFVKAGSANVSSDDAVLVKEFTYASDADGTNWYVRVMKADGTETYYKMDTDTTVDNKAISDPIPAAPDPAHTAYAWGGVNADALHAGNIVQLELSADGKTVHNFKTYNTSDEIIGPYQASKNKDNATITVNDIDTPATKLVQVQSDTKFFTVKNYENHAVGITSGIVDGKFITWADVKGTYADDFAGAKLTVVYDGAKAKFVFIDTDKTVTSDMNVGVLSSKGLNGSDKVLNVLLPSGMATVKYSDWAGLSTKTLVYYKSNVDNEVDGTVVTATPYTVGGYVRYEVRSVSTGADKTKIVTLRKWNENATVGSDIQVLVKDGYTNYINCDNDPVKVDGVGVGDHVMVYDQLDSDGNFNGNALAPATPGDGIIDFVLIQDKL